MYKNNDLKSEAKSLFNWIGKLISNLNYADFSPAIDKHALLEKFETFFKENNYYWDFYQPEDKWTRWLFIALKSFEKHTPLYLGLYFNNNVIEYVIFGQIIGPNFTPKHYEGKISLIKAWLDHSYLHIELTRVIKEALDLANPSLKT